jgi:hypothetical protein
MGKLPLHSKGIKAGLNKDKGRNLLRQRFTQPQFGHERAQPAGDEIGAKSDGTIERSQNFLLNHRTKNAGKTQPGGKGGFLIELIRLIKDPPVNSLAERARLKGKEKTLEIRKKIMEKTGA